jgi:outer membrane protein OmpA-like peptidoglycan-associated protein
MALHATLPRPAQRTWWSALVMVPLVLAALGLALFPLAAPLAPQAAPPPTASVPVLPAPAYPLAFADAGAITFAADQADLVGPSAAAVDRVARLLGGGNGPRVTVTGFAADTPGPADVAQRLSQRRAQVVVDALVAAGVRKERLVAVGRGAAAPLATPAQSRRVEFTASRN